MATNLIKGQSRTIVPQSPRLAGLNTSEELMAGVAASFPILGIKGSRWHYRFHGDDMVIPNPSNPREYAQTLNVVIVQSGVTLTRTFYPPGSYVEGANNRPSCWSSDGVRPDGTVPEPVNPVCATCPNAEWGSGATPAAPRAQACQQRRRVVVVPYPDLANKGDGPMLLSVPPGSLRDLQDYGGWLKNNGLEACGAVTELRFDSNVAFPKIIFDYVTSLSHDETDYVLDELRDKKPVLDILNSRINIDGPEADDGAPTGGAPGAAGGAPGAAAKAPKAPPSPPRQQPVAQPPAQAAPPPPPPPVQVAPATPPAPSVGGFAVPPPPPRVAPTPSVPPPPPRAPAARVAAPIAAAVAQPAPPPASARAVKASPSGNGAQPPEEPTVTGSIGAELDASFGDLMRRA